MTTASKPKRGRPRLEDRANTTEAQKPWIAKGMSRSTWYRIKKDPERKRAFEGFEDMDKFTTEPLVSKLKAQLTEEEIERLKLREWVVSYGQ